MTKYVDELGQDALGRVLHQKPVVRALVAKWLMLIEPKVSWPCSRQPFTRPLSWVTCRVRDLPAYFVKTHFNIILSMSGFWKWCFFTSGFPTCRAKLNKPWFGYPNNTWCGDQIIAGKNVIRNKIFVDNSRTYILSTLMRIFNPLCLGSICDVQYFRMVYTQKPTWDPASFAVGFVAAAGASGWHFATLQSIFVSLCTRSFNFTILGIESLRHRK